MKTEHKIVSREQRETEKQRQFELKQQNVKIKGFTIKNQAGGYYGVITGVNHGKILNCMVTDSILESRGIAGGICGYNYGMVQACKVQSVSVSGDVNVGGMVGWNDEGSIIDCNSNSVTLGASDRYYCNMGGIVGYMAYGVVSNSSTTGNCVFLGPGVGGNIGAISGNGHSGYKIIECWTDTDYRL